jgi:hypothetical protein
MNLVKLVVFAFCVFSAGAVFSDEEIVFETAYWEGKKCLENGVPWQVPASVYKEAEHCRKDDVALELGTGGSTIFLAKRCKHVIAIETNPNWAARVQEELDRLNLTNVTLICMQKQAEIEAFLRDLDTDSVNILSVDTICGYNRSGFVNAVLQKGISEHLRMVVLDNYGASRLFPDHHNKEAIDSEEWESFVYNDPHWWGYGTKLYIKKND